MAVIELPDSASALLVLAHGAGAGMRHRSMEALAEALACEGIGTYRYNFPYMDQLERGEKVSGNRFAKPPLLAAVRAAVKEAAKDSGDLPLFAGGKSMGGRMTSLAASEAPLSDVRGLIFFGFPLHPAGKPSTERAEHLSKVDMPMLFLQGTKDALATPELLTPIVESLGPKATLLEFEGADHSFHVSKGAGLTDGQVLQEIARAVRAWTDLYS